MGLSVRVDLSKATDWYRKAADHGFTKAQYNLGVFYLNGQGGCPKDPATAVDWFRKAADQGLAIAQRNMGVLYWNGTGVEADECLGMEWYQKAAKGGDTEAARGLQQGYPEIAEIARAAIWLH